MSIRALPDALRDTLWIVVAALAATVANAAADTEAERARIDSERRAAAGRYEEALRECGGRFAQTVCADEARAARRAAFERLDAERAELDDRERRLRAANRQAAIAQRQTQQRATAHEPAAQAELPMAAARSGPMSEPSPLFGARETRQAVDRPTAARREADVRARWHERERKVQAHQEAVRQRNAERAARKPPAAALPVPAASAVSR